MPFKPLSNALLNPYKAPIGTHLYNYLITNNLRRSLINSFLTHFLTFSLHILSIYFEGWWTVGAGCWVVGVEWWVLMVSIKFIVNPHIIITQHSIPHIINTQHSSPNTHPPTSNTLPPTFNPTHHQHPSPITHHPSPNTQYPSPIISHPINFIISFFLCKFAVK